MALFNHATKEVTAKLVYYGPGLCGKTTNLQWIHENLSFKTKGKLVSLATQTDRTLFFDFLPVELGTIRGMRTRMQIYTVPGQVFYESTRRMVLKGCDAVVFVADSQAAMLDANAESLRSLRQNLLVNEIDPSIPQVIQYNKRDLPTALPISVLNARLNPRNLPYFEAVAFKGTGVEETLKGITRLLFQWLARYYGEGDGPPAAARRASARRPRSRTAAPGEGDRPRPARDAQDPAGGGRRHAPPDARPPAAPVGRRRSRRPRPSPRPLRLRRPPPGAAGRPPQPRSARSLAVAEAPRPPPVAPPRPVSAGRTPQAPPPPPAHRGPADQAPAGAARRRPSPARPAARPGGAAAPRTSPPRRSCS